MVTWGFVKNISKESFMKLNKENFLADMISKNYNNLTKSGKKLAEFILNNPEDSAFMSSTKLGEMVNVSEATVIRFATELGCTGFPALQDILQNYLKERIKPSERLKQYSKIRKETHIYTEIFRATAENLNITQENLRPEILDEIVNRITIAKKIYIIGFRRSFSVAYLLNYNLGSILSNTVLIDANYGLMFDKTIEMKKNDVCIGISFPRYATQTYQIIQYAKGKGCTTIVITDSVISPIAQVADYVLTAKYEIPSFFHSNICALTLIDCIVTGVSRKRKKSVNLLANFEKSLQKWNTWVVT
jgi:DNA-binding MurR/RpiR family transcriptional regulator